MKYIYKIIKGLIFLIVWLGLPLIFKNYFGCEHDYVLHLIWTWIPSLITISLMD